MKRLGPSPEAFDQPPSVPIALRSMLFPSSHERERVDPPPLAHARGYIDQAEASIRLSDLSRMKRRIPSLHAMTVIKFID